MDNPQFWWGAASLVFCAFQYAAYFHGIFRGRVKPHIFSWLIWALISGIGFAAQLGSGGGAGAWAAGFTGLLCLAIVALSLTRGEKNITRIDWLALGCGLAAVAAWRITHDPLHAVILALIANILGLIPTIRKSVKKPYEESLLAYSMSCMKWVCSLAALKTLTWTSTLYAAGIMVLTALLIVFVAVRRFQLKSRH